MSASDREKAILLRAKAKDRFTHVRLSVLIMLDENYPRAVISVATGVDETTVYRIRHNYQAKGLDAAISRNIVPCSPSLCEKGQALLAVELDAGIYTTCRQIADWVRSNLGVSYSDEGMRVMLHGMGYTYKKLSPRPCKADPEAQDEFASLMKDFIENGLNEGEEVHFMDAVHPMHNTRPDYAWVKKGEERPLLTNSGRARININGSVMAGNPVEVHAKEYDAVNAESAADFLCSLAQKRREKGAKKVYVVCDNARYYRSGFLKERIKNTGIRLVFLPPYSPNLNLAERLWKLMRKEVVNLKYYPTFGEFKQAVMGFFANISVYKEKLESLMTLNFQSFSAKRSKCNTALG